MLRHLLAELRSQETDGQFTYSIVVADNDESRSAESVVGEFAASAPIAAKYCVEPRRGIAHARNCVVSNATGDYVAFLDDDEFPAEQWLLRMFQTLRQHDVAGVLGPVKSYFPPETPKWVIEGGLFDRAPHPTGMKLIWEQCRSGNVLLKRSVLAQSLPPFRPEFLNGEDQDFFRRMMENGHTFVWCNEAVAFEEVPPARWKRSFLVRRAVFRGVFSQRNRKSAALPILQSLVAAPAYAVFLPIALLLGQSRFMSCVYKGSYHVGRLLAAVGINPIAQTYVSE